MISVMLWPAGTGSNAGPAVHTSQGYHLLHWTDPSFTYWVVSDLGMSELEEFVSLVRRSH